jgi:hypothetical protein
MGKPHYPALTAGLICRGVTMRRVRIVGPDGQFLTVETPVEGPVAEPPHCGTCGQLLLPS